MDRLAKIASWAFATALLASAQTRPCIQIVDSRLAVANGPMNAGVDLVINSDQVVGSFFFSESQAHPTIVNGSINTCLEPGVYAATITVKQNPPFSNITLRRTWTIPSTGGPYRIQDIQSGSPVPAPTASIALSQITPGAVSTHLVTDTDGVVKWLSMSAGSGTVTSFSWGTIPAWLIGGVATSTTTPVASLTFNTQTANTFLGNTGTFRALVNADMSAINTSGIGEGSNLYHTDARSVAAVVAGCTDSWVLYRFSSAIGCSANLTYNGFLLTLAKNSSSTVPHTIGTVPAGALTGSNILFVGDTPTATNNGVIHGVVGLNTASGANVYMAIHGEVFDSEAFTSTQTVNGGQRAIRGRYNHGSTGTVAMASVFSSMFVTSANGVAGTGLVTDAHGYLSAAPTITIGTSVTNYYGFRAQTSTVSGAIANYYGLKVDPIARTGITVPWGVYVDSDPSYFGANVGFGNGTTTTNLFQASTARFTVQPAGASGNGTLVVMPAGASPTGSLQAWNSSDVSNSARFSLNAGGAVATLAVSNVGTPVTPITTISIGSGPSVTAMNFLDGPGVTRAIVDGNGFGVSSCSTINQAPYVDVNGRLICGASHTFDGTNLVAPVYVTGTLAGGIQMYLSNATRVRLQPLTANQNMNFALQPNGTAVLSGFEANNSSDGINFARAKFGVNGAIASIDTVSLGSPVTPITIFNLSLGGVLKALWDANGFGLASTSAQQTLYADVNNRVAGASGSQFQPWIQGAVSPSFGVPSASATATLGTILDGDCANASTITLTGASLGDVVFAGVSVNLPAGINPSAKVTATNTVTVEVCNLSEAPYTVGSATYKVGLLR